MSKNASNRNMAVAASERAHFPAWQTEPCPAWCCIAPHSVNEMPEDRSHFSPYYVSDMPLTLQGEIYRDGFVLDVVAVYLQQHYRETEPRVRIEKNGCNDGIEMTLAEARQLLAGLTDALAKASA